MSGAPVAVVDIGSIAVRLLITDGVEVRRWRRVTRTSDQLEQTGSLGHGALGRVAAVLADYAAAIREAGVREVRVVATEAARRATDVQDLVDVVRREIGAELEIIDGEREGRLAFTGVTASARADAAPDALFVVIDIGGGSTELSFGSAADGVLGVISLPTGAARVTSEFLHHDPPGPDELSGALSVVRLHLDDAQRELPNLVPAIDRGTVFGVGGTAVTTAAVEIGLLDDDRSVLHGFELEREAVEDVFRTLATESAEDRAHNPGLPADRVDLIVGGCCVLVEAMRRLDIEVLTVSDGGVADGVALEMIRPS